MSRPILVAVIGYLIGIIWGLYLNVSIVPFYIIIAVLYIILKKIFPSNLFKFQRYFRYIRLYFNEKSILIVLIFSIISNIYLFIQNEEYNILYNEDQDIELIGIIDSQVIEKDYENQYKLKVLEENQKEKKIENKYVIIKVDKEQDILEYGAKVKIKGKWKKPKEQRNEGGFNDKQYLKTLKVLGRIKVEKISIIDRNCGNIFFEFSYKISAKISKQIDILLDKEEASIFKGILLGDTSSIDDSLKNDFQIANISHVLAVSGMNVSYIIIGIRILFQKLLGKQKNYIFTIIILVFYIFLTGFSPSIVRAVIMGIIFISSKLFFRKSDTYTSLSISLLVLLIYNPFLILNIGLQLSYLGTLGILIFNSSILELFNKINLKKCRNRIIRNKYVLKMIDKIKEILAVTFSAQIIILPFILFYFNIFGTYFVVSNLLVSFIIGPIIIIGIIVLAISFINSGIMSFFAEVLEIILSFLIKISYVSNLPISKIYFPTLKKEIIAVYIVIILIIRFLIYIYSSKKWSYTIQRFRNLIALFKYKSRKNKKKVRNALIVFLIVILLIYKYPKDLRINFVDVGQGDCTFIITPYNNTILIDGGGSETFDVGKSTLLPYILDKGYTSIDYIFISHFDNDHVDGILYLLEEINVGQVIIPKQFETSANYERFIKIVKERGGKVRVVKKGDEVGIEKNLKFNILWPQNDFIEENVINNNSMICMLKYNNFSMLFTGDVERIAEEKFLNYYENTNLISTVLKIAHHGSKTSSTEKFISKVKPKIALIGVGENNLFGHPSNEVLDRLRKINCQIYRTDSDGEIGLVVKENGTISIDKMINN